MSNTQNRHLKIRNKRYFAQRLSFKKRIEATIIRSGTDSRLYADVLIDGIKIVGLLDSGANISILGKECDRFFNRPGVKFHNLPSTVTTANGQEQRVFGYVVVPFTFGKHSGTHIFYLVPSLTQELYLGIDFWYKVGIVPSISEEVEKSNDTKSIPDDVEEIPANEKRHNLSVEDSLKLQATINKFPDAKTKGLGRTDVLEHEITLLEDKPVKQRYYAISPAIQRDVYDEIDRMLELGVIEESQSPWCSPMAIVRKKSGKARLCLDARKVNDLTKKDAYPLPLVEGLLSRLESTHFISSIDLKDAFWQIPLKPSSREITAFTVQGRPLYQFRVMPFGLCNAAQTLCRLMHRVIPHQLHDRIFVYLDDFLVTSTTFEEHLSLLELVANWLTEAGLTINLEKSKFCLKEVEYLGYVVGEGCLRVNNDKVKAIAEFPIPKTVRQVRRFLGMTGWYRRFIPRYSSISAPLTDLLRKGSRLNWSESTNLAFESLKSSLISAPILRHPDFDKRFFIQCDASSDGIGSVLFQKDESGNDCPIAYYSHKLNRAQRNYSVSELECLAAVMSIKKFRAYVEGMPFTVITDHSSLQWLMNQNDLTGRLARWSLKLQCYNFDIQYCKGSVNKVPDALSRVFSVEAVGVSQSDSDRIGIDISDPSFKSPEYLDLVVNIKNGKFDSNLTVKNDLAFINTTGSYVITDTDTDISEWKLIVPFQLTASLIKRAHLPPSSAHQGVSKTIEILRRTFYWKGLARDVKDFVSACDLCKTSKAVNYATQPMMGNIIETFRPFQRLYVDFMGPYPRTRRQNTHILIVVDHFSRFTLCKAVKRATAVEVVNFLTSIFDLYGVPEILFSDNGKQFESHHLSDFLKKFGVTQQFTAKYSPQSNISERVNRSILAAIRTYLNDVHTEWVVHLNEICSALRNTVHESTGFSPHYLVFGQHFVSNGETYSLLKTFDSIESNFLKISSKTDRLTVAQSKVISNLRESHRKHSEHYNLRSRHRKFNVGQIVFFKNFVQSKAIDKFSAKLAPKFLKGKIVREIGNVMYEIEDVTGKSMGIYHSKDIR